MACNLNLRKSMPGTMVSAYYHFTEKVVAGVEVNRFYQHRRRVNEEENKLSAWDIDMNLHYHIPLSKKLFFYPLAGLGHTSERDENVTKGEVEMNNFYSVNAGTGILLELKRFTPFIEYMHTWGEINQEFFLVGVGYAIHLGHKGKH